MLGIYTFVFGYIFGGSFADETPLDHSLGIFIGLAIHNFISDIIAITPTLISGNSTFVKKVVFPLVILVASKVSASLLTLTIKAAIIITAALCLGHPFTLNYFAIIPLIISLIILTFGIGLIFASIGVFIKDLANVSQFLSMGLLFGSAIFYPLSKIPEQAWTYLRFNPLIFIIDSIRGVILWNHPISLNYITVPAIFALCTFILGAYCFQKLRPAFSDVI
jgi:lipopolysaccharide transport system permease protein